MRAKFAQIIKCSGLDSCARRADIALIDFAFSLLLCFAFLMFILQFFHFKLMLIVEEGC